MKILLMHGSLNALGGAEVLHLSLAGKLEELGIEYRLMMNTLSPEIRQAFADRKLLHRLQPLNSNQVWWSPLTLIHVLKAVRDYQPDVVQTSQFIANSWAGPIKWFTGTPLVISEEHGWQRWKRGYHHALLSVSRMGVDRIITVSEALATHLQASEHVPAKKIRVFHNPVRDAFLQPLRRNPEYRKQLGLSPDTILLGHVGSLRKEKNPAGLLAALARIKQQHTDLKLLLIGSGPEEEAVRQQIARLNLEQDVILLGQQQDIVGWLDALDIFVFPSLEESFGIALLEAMARGLPVVASRAGGITEFVTHERNGLLVDAEATEELAKSILRLIQQPELRRELGRKARQYVETHHSLQAYIDRLLVLYAEAGKQ